MSDHRTCLLWQNISLNSHQFERKPQRNVEESLFVISEFT